RHSALGLSHLILDYISLQFQYGAKCDWMDRQTAIVPKYVIKSPLDVLDATQCGAAGAHFLQERYFVGQFVADQWLHKIREVSDVHLGREDTGRDRSARAVD